VADEPFFSWRRKTAAFITGEILDVNGRVHHGLKRFNSTAARFLVAPRCIFRREAGGWFQRMMRIRKRLLEIHDLPGLEVEDPRIQRIRGGFNELRFAVCTELPSIHAAYVLF